jgi:hypothetical protein
VIILHWNIPNDCLFCTGISLLAGCFVPDTGHHSETPASQDAKLPKVLQCDRLLPYPLEGVPLVVGRCRGEDSAVVRIVAKGEDGAVVGDNAAW